MRTQIKNKEYFSKYIDLNQEDIEYFEEGLTTGRTKEDRISAVKRGIFMISLRSIIAKYSSGYNISELKEDFPNVIEKLLNGWDYEDDFLSMDDYISMLWMLSLAVLLDIDDENFERIVKVLDTNKQEDYIFDTIIASRIKNRNINSNLLYPNQFEFLKKLNEIKDIQGLKEYLDKNWYKKFTSTYWYDYHKSKNDVFFGYWSFESGAFVKILGLDDVSLKDQQYYPYDLVHWKG